ncbi:MAG: tetratricopeptide repeat protein, partial [Alphaproteobacteria bacterium]
METLDQIWKFVIENPGAATFILAAGLAVLGGLWKAYTHFFPKAGPVATANTERIVHVLTGKVESANQREQEHRDQIRQLTEPLFYMEGAPPIFTGREEDIKRLRAALLGDNRAGAAITSVEGIGGIGKTALALHVAHQLKREGHFRGGQMFIDLRGFSPGLEPMTPEEALTTLLRRMDPAAELPDTVPELRLQWLRATADRKMLVFLDNARDEEQVRPLLSGDRACVVIVTSRLKLALPGLEPIPLDQMPPDDAADLAMKIGNSHNQTRLGRNDAGRLVELCGYLPLAVRIAASTLDVKSNLVVDEFLARLADHKTKLATLKLGNESVAASLASSLDVLDDESRRHWRALSVFAGSFTGAAAKHVWGLEAADALLGEFVAQNLLTHDQETTRFRLHDLLRAMALQELESHPDETTAARVAHAEHYFMVLTAANAFYHKGDDEVLKGLALLDVELENIAAGQQWASGNLKNDDRAAHLARQYPHFRCLDLRLSLDVNLRWLKAALDAARHLGDRESEATALGNLGNLYQTRGELDRAEDMYEKGLEIDEALGSKEGMASKYGNLGILYKTRGDLDRAEEMYRKSLELHEALGRKEGMASTYGNLGSLYMTRGDLDHAEEMFRKSLKIDEALGRKEGMASTYGNLGILYKTRGDLDRAEEMFRKGLELDEALGRKEGMAIQYGNLGILYKTRGEFDRAEEMYRKSLKIE